MAEETTCKCPLCGHDGYPKSTLTDDQKDGFVMCMLAEVPFSLAYPMMGGRITVTAQDLNEDSKASLVNLQMWLKKTIGEKLTEYLGEINAVLRLVQTTLSISKVDIKVGSKECTYEKRDAFTGFWEQWTSKESSGDVSVILSDMISQASEKLKSTYKVPESLLISVSTKHSDLVENLVASCYDENFWKGTGC